MRCKACDVLLNDFETTRKIVLEDSKIEYPDLCNTCFKESNIGKIYPTIERVDLEKTIINEDGLLEEDWLEDWV